MSIGFIDGQDGGVIFASGKSGAIVFSGDAVRVDDASAAAAAASAAAAAASAAQAAAEVALVNTIAVADTTALAALDEAQWLAAITADGTQWLFTDGDFSAEITALDPRYVGPDSDPTGASGAWVKVWVKNDPADFHQFKAYTDESVNFEVEALEGATSALTITGGLPVTDSLGEDFGPTISATGDADDIDIQVAPKGEGKLTIGNALGKIVQFVMGAATYVTDRIIRVSGGATGQSYPKIDADAGLDISMGGDLLVRMLDGAGSGTAPLYIENTGTDYIVLYTGSGKSLVLQGDGLQLQSIGLMDFQYQVSTVASGDTMTLSQFVGIHLVNPVTGTTIAALTINFPASPVDGTVVRLSPRHAVTTVTWVSLGGHSFTGAPTGLAKDNPISFIYFNTYGWQRI